MREIRLFVSVLFLLILTVPFIGCSKTEDEEQETSTVAAHATAPAEHEVVSTVREFLKTIEGGDYDRAIELGTPNEFKREGLVKTNEAFDFNNAEITEAYVGNENAAVLTNSIPAPTATMQFGHSLVKSGDRWLIRDVDMLPNNDSEQKWLAGFKGVEPNVKRVVGSD